MSASESSTRLSTWSSTGRAAQQARAPTSQNHTAEVEEPQRRNEDDNSSLDGDVNGQDTTSSTKIWYSTSQEYAEFVALCERKKWKSLPGTTTDPDLKSFAHKGRELEETADMREVMKFLTSLLILKSKIYLETLY